jgi:hypothetical protein
VPESLTTCDNRATTPPLRVTSERPAKPERLPFLLARVGRTGGQQAYVCSGCHRYSGRVGPAGAGRACRRLDGLSDREASESGIGQRATVR